MKCIKHVWGVLLLLIYCTSLSAINEYEFSLNPSMEEWKTLSVEVKIEMLQIPTEELKTISTEKLVYAYLNHPLRNLMFAYNTTRDGYLRIYKEFNGLRELNLRNDGPEKIIEIYSKMNPNAYNSSWESKQEAQHILRFVYIETLLSQPEIFNQLNIDDSKVLIESLLQKYNQKLAYKNIHTLFGLESCAYAMGKVLNRYSMFSDSENEIDSVMTLFLDTGKLHDPNIIDEVIIKAQEFCNK